jgi:NRPS condensation-like uncharacterized protein
MDWKPFEKTNFPLNGLDKFILAHETSHIHYNSQFLIELSGNFDSQKFELTVDSLIEQIPALRSKIKTKPWGFKRTIYKKSWFKAKEIIYTKENLTDSDIDDFCYKSFDLKNDPPIRFLISKNSTSTLIVFSVHHSLCDGAGQALILEELLRVWSGKPVSYYSTKTKTVHWRDFSKKMGMLWVLKQLYINFKSGKATRVYNMASLVDNQNAKGRRVTARVTSLAGYKRETIEKNCQFLKMTLSEYLAYCSFLAMNTCLKTRNSQLPIMIYMPKNMRHEFKIRKSLQNIISTVLLVAKPKDVETPQLIEKIKKKIQSHNMDTAVPFIFRVMLADSLIPPYFLRKKYQRMDRDPDSQTCTLFISAGTLPRKMSFPTEWGNIKVSARGTMLKSPGLGLILTGIKGQETLTLEYIQSLFKVETIEMFEKSLQNELFKKRYISDPLSVRRDSPKSLELDLQLQ